MKKSLLNFINRIKANIGKTRNGQLGLSILGALLALVIGALLTIPIVNAFLDSQRKTRVETNLQDMRTIVADVQRTFGNTNQYGALNTAVGVQSNVIPARLRVGTTTAANNSYNGAIGFAATTVTVTNDATTLSWANVPKADCTDLVFGIEPLTRGVLVGAVSVKPNDGVIDAAGLSAACDTTASVTLNLVIGRKG